MCAPLQEIGSESRRKQDEMRDAVLLVFANKQVPKHQPLPACAPVVCIPIRSATNRYRNTSPGLATGHDSSGGGQRSQGYWRLNMAKAMLWHAVYS